MKRSNLSINGIRLIVLVLLLSLILIIMASAVNFKEEGEASKISVAERYSRVLGIVESNFNGEQYQDFNLTVFSIGGKRLDENATKEYSDLVFLAEFSSSSAIIIAHDDKYYFDEKYFIDGENPFQKNAVKDEEKTLFVLPNGLINFCKIVGYEVFSLTNGEKVQYTVMTHMINAVYDNFLCFNLLELN